MTNHQERILSLLMLACYEALAGKLPSGMLPAVAERLGVRRWDSAEEFIEAARLVAEEFVAEHVATPALTSFGGADNEAN